MKCHEQRLTVSLLALTLSIATFIPPRFAQAATITVVNADGPGEGLNDPTAVSPVGGNPGTTVGAQRLKALQFAADLWGTRLKSSVEIRVGAHFDPFNDPSSPCKPDSGPIGGAGPTILLRGFSGAPAPNMWFPVALANSLAGADLDPTHDDIDAEFNSNVGIGGCLTGTGFYYGFDGSPAANEIDFVSIVLHELAHGLGLETFVDLKTGAKLMGFDDTFMRFLEDHSTGKLYPAMTNAERAAASMNTGNLHWVGANVVAAGNFLVAGRDPASGHVEMFAPNPQQPGSSVSHFSDALFPDELMEPAYTGPNHTINLTAQLLKDVGWQTTTGTQQTLENPQPDSSQSGISVISGWVCDAQSVRILIDGESFLDAAYGTSREDTRPTCGDANNGFGVLYNWNVLGEGQHTVALCVDGVCGQSVPVHVNTYGTEFLRDLHPDPIVACTNTGPTPFPTVTVLVWQESQQNWAIALTPTCQEVQTLCAPPVAPPLQQLCPRLAGCC
jgi:hypothetical protein